MTEVGLTPSQTAGPYLQIGLLAGPLTTDSSTRVRSRARSASAASCSTDARATRCRRHGRDLAGERGRPLRTSGGRPREIPLEDGFPGFGRSGTEDDRPLRVRDGQARPRAVARRAACRRRTSLVGVFARGLLKASSTRMYFPGRGGGQRP